MATDSSVSSGGLKLSWLGRRADLAFTSTLFVTVMLLIVPVPALVLDLLLSVSLGFSLLILMVIVYVKDPPEFSGFPTILLAFTLFRLALNICSTRLILTEGEAGGVIQSFGNFVLQGNYVVGFVIFLILVLINFVVITKGAGRIAEVTARFTLDALPGKQMGIDAELNAGIIDEVTASSRRQKVQKEADFYGSMDGASKFVRGEAIAGILITLVNVVAGFAIGVMQMDLSLAESAQKFTLLSIGDGLVSQIPALIVSVAAGVLVTRASGDNDLGVQIGRQIFRYPRALKAMGGMMLVFGLLPGMPLLPFGLLGGMAYWVGRELDKESRDAEGNDLNESGGVAAARASSAAHGKQSVAGAGDSSKGGNAAPEAITDEFRKVMNQDTFAVEVGMGLLPLADAQRGGDLLGRITGVRKNLARERGLVVPPISVRDNLELEPNEYRFLLRGRAVGRGAVMAGQWMAMNVSGSRVVLKGTPCLEPVFGIAAVWIEESERKAAEISGHTVVDAASVIITHLSEVLKSSAHLLLSRQDVQTLIDHVRPAHPALVAELLPDLVSLGVIQRVLQNLLRENVPVLALPVILEGIADFAPTTKNPDDLSELVRRRMGMYFVSEYENKPGSVRAITLDPRLEQLLATRVLRGAGEIGLALDPGLGRHLLDKISNGVGLLSESGDPGVVVTGAELRLPLQRFLEPSFPRLAVLSFQELPPSTEVENVGIVTLPVPTVAAAGPPLRDLAAA
jgi:flagellar biosynthesis protein FlhA